MPARSRPAKTASARRPLIRSAGIRFAIIYAAVFGISAAALALALWYTTAGLLQRQVLLNIHNDAIALGDHYEVGGTPSLIEAISDRLADNPDNDSIYLLIDALGNRVTGNLDQWPGIITRFDSWYEIPVTRKGVGSVATLHAYLLDDGDRLLIGRDVRALTQLRNVLRDGMIWALGVMIVLGIFGALLIRSIFRRMIRDISATTRAIARGDLSHRIARSNHGDEFNELAEIINNMLDRISRLMDGVRQVSNSIAHDLRTPITRARTRLEDASLHSRTDAELRAAIERATMDLDSIVGVFEALLRIAEIEAGSRRAAFAAIDLAPLIHDIDDLYHAVAEELGLALQASIIGPLRLLGDRQLIQQAIANLLDNALKFSSPGAAITLNAMATDDMIEITIADHGPGISEADRTRATERFFRAESARSTAGSGLGLALVAAVAQLHNGTLRLADNNPGLRAIITLPARVDAAGK